MNVFAESWVAIEAIGPISLKRWLHPIDAHDLTIAADPNFALVHATGTHAVDESSRMA
jgi:hypothetical protein